MLTIRAMAAMGPWILTHIDVLRRRGDEQCQRCGENLRYVWVMEKQTEPKEVWRIGSTCGPTLELVSEEMWNKLIKPFTTSIDLLLDLEHLAKWELEYPALLPRSYELGWAEKQRAIIAAGDLTAHQRMVLGHHIRAKEKAYRLSLRRHAAG